ncbi:hypothetical protein [Lysobacter gummosus]|uniref:hypothetical protein n=1 Tax=Lysobacter gummosus TaxID=262324 RepID=UPI003625BF0F
MRFRGRGCSFVALFLRKAIFVPRKVLLARHSRERWNPVPFVRERLKSLDSRVRGNDGWERTTT